MNKLLRVLIIIFISAISLSQNSVPARAAKTVIKWVHFGIVGTEEEVMKAPSEVVRKFNESQDDIELELLLAYGNRDYVGEFPETVKSGFAFDIVGQIWPSAMYDTEGYWLDLAPLIKKHNYDLNQFPKNLIEQHKENGKLITLPFAAYQSVIFYNADLFDQANLEYPPARYGQTYRLDGKQVEWNWDTVAEIAKRLTLDDGGRNATSPNFSPDTIQQFGYLDASHHARLYFSTFGGASVVNTQGKVEIPEQWREAARWYHAGMWKDHFIPNKEQVESILHGYSGFQSGRVAMSHATFGYLCCIADLKANWNLAVMPSYKGEVYAPTGFLNFYVHKDTQHPDAAFRVLQYLTNEGALTLLTAQNRWTGYPLYPGVQNEFNKLLSAKFPTVMNWDVVNSSFEYTVLPGPDSYVPNYLKVSERFNQFDVMLREPSSKDFNLDAELDKLEADLQVIIDTKPTEELP